MKKYLKFIIPIVAILVIGVGVFFIIKINSPYKIKSLKVDNNSLYLNLNKVKGATNYLLEVFDKNDEKVFVSNVTELKNNVDLSSIKKDGKYYVVIKAYNKNNKLIKRTKNNEFNFKNVINKDEIVNADANIVEETTTTTTTTKRKITTTKVVDSNPISKIVLSSKDIISKKNDINVSFTGGANADKIIYNLYGNNVLLKTVETTSNSITVSSDLLTENNNYKLEVIATKDEFSRSASININVVSTSRESILVLARSQIGNAGGKKFWSWYGYNGRVEWCATFISWLAYQTGYLQNGEIPKFANTGVGARFYKDRGTFVYGGSAPEPGDIVFFDWDVNGRIDHVGIVERVDDTTVYTIEGNSKDAVREKQYPITSKFLYGYGKPNYEKN